MLIGSLIFSSHALCFWLYEKAFSFLVYSFDIELILGICYMPDTQVGLGIHQEQNRQNYVNL